MDRAKPYAAEQWEPYDAIAYSARLSPHSRIWEAWPVADSGEDRGPLLTFRRFALAPGVSGEEARSSGNRSAVL